MIVTTYSVCGSCLLHSANGECGECYEDDNHQGFEPNGSLIPGDEEYGFGTWPCEGCGSTFHGDRFEAVTIEPEETS